MIVANDDLATTSAVTPVVVDVLANDTLNGNPVAVGDLAGPPVVITPPSNGTATVNPDGTVTYTPNPGFCGTDTFEYGIEAAPEPLEFTAGEGVFRVSGFQDSVVEWGDGTPDTVLHTGAADHTYAPGGPYTGRITQVAGGAAARALAGPSLLAVTRWGSVPLEGSFRFSATSGLNRTAPNLVSVPSTPPPGATILNNMFSDATSFNQDIGGWGTSGVEYMANMFYGATSFNQDLSGWCVEQIASEPTGFATNTPAWTLPKPNWGAPC